MPKIDNKEKLRKAAKGLGLGLLSVFATIGIVATIACLARCGERPKQEASAEDVSLPYVRQPRKGAPIVDEDANVLKGDNLRVLSRYSFSTSDGNFDFSRVPTSEINIGHVPIAGLYYLKLEVREHVLVASDQIADAIADAYSVGAGIHVTTASLSAAYFAFQEGYFRFTEEEVANGVNFVIRSPTRNIPPKLYAIDLMQASPSDKVSLPEGWKPFELIDCEPKQNGFGVCNPRTSASLSPTGQGVVKGLLFRSNGKLYNRVNIWPWSPYADDDSNTPAHTFGYYDASGRLVWKTLGGDSNDMIIYRINFSFVSSDLPNYHGTAENRSDDVAYCPETSVIVEQQARVVYLSAGPLTWNSPLFRELEVLDVYDEQIKPTDTLMARSPLEWLRLSLADVNQSTPTTDVGVKDGMTLVSDGIVAFMPILGIEVLPSISLGLLLILPLIGGIIVLIVKVFSK